MYRFVLEDGGIRCEFDESGALLQITRAGKPIPFSGLQFDMGCNEENLTHLLEYDSLLDNHTWDLPQIRPVHGGWKSFPAREVSRVEGALTVTYEIPPVAFSLKYQIVGDALSVTALVENKSAAPVYLNTLTLDVPFPSARDVTFDFPCNTPAVPVSTGSLAPYETVCSGLVSFAVHSKTPDCEWNTLFIDDVEKWGCGVYHDGSLTHTVYSAHLEANLDPKAVLSCGTLYLQPVEGNPYLQIRRFVETLGYRPVQDGIRSGVMYSCHPSGTLDSDFPLKQDLREYAGYLETLKRMGIDHVWLLPIFDHGEQNVYHSTDQSIIDARYGGDEATRYYVEEAHRLGMTVLFDYVPHGPGADHPLAKEHPDWCSKRRDGTLHEEWNCVSMDYNHPGYQDYTTELVYDHVKRFDIDGARIDCAMGGLSNWRPYGENRPSADSVQAGVNISRAIRRGFVKGGKSPLNMPENFHPIPPYYSCTDVFYGMNLYRVFVELEPLFRTDPAKYASGLTHWLRAEKLTTPEDYVKMRFLGNHDTVSWVWQAKRAVDCYGEDGAKALWALISLIDGMPMIYQGDEDPTLYLAEGPNLTEFFTRLFHDRKEYLPDSNATQYLDTGTPVMAFLRGEKKTRLVLVNLSAEPQEFLAQGCRQAAVLAGDASLSGEVVSLPGYSYAILGIAPEEECAGA